MNSLFKYVFGIAAGAFAAAGPALANVCGQFGTPPCPIPEPGTLSLVGLAVAVGIGLALRKRK